MYECVFLNIMGLSLCVCVCVCVGRGVVLTAYV